MKKLILAIMLMTSTMFASSISVETLSKMTDREQRLVMDAITNKSSEIVPTVETVEKAEKWANIGVSIGKALAGTAKELGVEVNNFAKTDVGRLATILVIWHFMGGMVMHMIGALILLAIALPLAHFTFKKIVGGSWETINNKKVYVSDDMTNDQAAMMILGYLAILISATLLAFTY